MKIYTKTGDKGQTGLFGGQRVSKTDARIEAYGTLDELNAYVGYVKALVQQTMTDDVGQIELLTNVQRELFNTGSHLATPYTADSVPASLPKLSAIATIELEQSIDQHESILPPLRAFILPGGTALASAYHIARTICRRAERQVVTLADTTYIDPLILPYLNRLSDWLFVMARVANHVTGQSDEMWK